MKRIFKLHDFLFCKARSIVPAFVAVRRAIDPEHSIVLHRSGDTAQSSMLPIGTRLRIQPNHACATSAQHGRYHLVAGREAAGEALWERLSGW